MIFASIGTWLAGKLGGLGAKLAEAIILLALVLAIPIGAYLLGGHNRGVADALAQAKSIDRARTQAATLAAQQLTATAQVEVRYVDRIQQVNVPVTQIRDRLVMAACPATTVGLQQPAGSAGALPVSTQPAAERADGAAGAAADDGVLGGVAAEIPACVRIRAQLEGLEAAVRVNSPQPQ